MKVDDTNDLVKLQTCLKDIKVWMMCSFDIQIKLLYLLLFLTFLLLHFIILHTNLITTYYHIEQYNVEPSPFLTLTICSFNSRTPGIKWSISEYE